MTITKARFKQLVLLNVAMLAGWIAVDMSTERFLPEALQEYLRQVYETPLSMFEGILLVIFGIYMIWLLQNMYALYTFKPYAPTHLLLIWIVSFPLSLANFTPAVFSPLSIFVYEFALALGGFILAIVFFSNIHSEFKRTETAQSILDDSTPSS